MSYTLYKDHTKVNYNKGNSGRKYIVIHYTGNTTDSAKANANYFRSVNRGASAHYFVDASSVYEVVDPANTAWAVGRNFGSGNLYGICTNGNSISIEMCSTGGKISDGTFANTVALTLSLMKKYSIPASRVVRHWDVCSKRCLPIDSTELLTPEGWIPLSDIKVGDIVAQFHTEDDSIDFTHVLDKVPYYESEVLKQRTFEATANHRMWAKPNSSKSHEFKEKTWGEMLEGNKQNIVKTYGFLDAEGLPLTDDELAFIIWTQADGHYMHEVWDGEDHVYGIEFHVKRKRKRLRIQGLLDSLGWEYKINIRSDGSVSYRIYGTEPFLFAEKWLDHKEFTYKLLGMNQHQFDVFWDELLQADGCAAAKMYTSAKLKNLDVVQAICATHGKRTSMTTLGSGRERYGDQPTGILENKLNAVFGQANAKSNIEKRKSLVSCVTVESGYILVRQNNRTFIVGNCPGWSGWLPSNQTLWNKFKSQIGGSAAASTSQSTASTTGSSGSASSSGVIFTYAVRTGGKILPAVTNLNDYAGIIGKPITDVAIKVNKGSIKYRVHVKGGGWLPWVTGYNWHNSTNGFAGNGRVIDAVQVILTGVTGKVAKYRVSPLGKSYYSWQNNSQTTGGQDGYAGYFGKALDRFQIY